MVMLSGDVPPAFAEASPYTVVLNAEKWLAAGLAEREVDVCLVEVITLPRIEPV
jgi:hypothetical protein